MEVEMAYRILTDEDIDRDLPSAIRTAIKAVENALFAKAEGKLVAPPRFSVSVERGALVFTVGAETLHSRTIGFRVYDTFPENTPEHTQIVAVFDSDTGSFKGIVLGNTLGAIRTAVINAVAIKHMARPDAVSLGILGTGFQVRFQLQAAVEVHPFNRVIVYSPTPAHREAFAQEMEGKLGFPIRVACSAEEVVRDADVLILATRSRTPVFEAGWIKPGTHINTIGPKFRDAHELPMEVARMAETIVTDSLPQVDAYSREFFLIGTLDRERMVELSDVVAGRKPGRITREGITLFCSVGLAGTEVVVADSIMKGLE